MINPNKSYKSKETAVIIKIDSLDAYIPYVTIKTESGYILEGNLQRVYSNPQLLKIGDQVRFTGQFSIVADKFMINKLIKIRKQIPLTNDDMRDNKANSFHSKKNKA